jgi:hypothetical protein
VTAATDPHIDANTDAVTAFITRWRHADGTERANCQTFVAELCALPDVP